MPNAGVAGVKRLKENIVPLAGLFLGLVLSIVGVGFVGMYLWEAVLGRWGEADQSLLFWYLPLLFIGLCCEMAGVCLILIARRKLKL